MKYIKIYENFLKDRNKLLDDIKSLDNKMLNEILDLIPDILDTGCVDYEFNHMSNGDGSGLPDRYELKLFLKKDKFFDKYLSTFKKDLRNIDNILNDYDIKYIWTYHNMILNYSPVHLIFNDISFLDKSQHDFFYERFDNLKIQLSLK